MYNGDREMQTSALKETGTTPDYRQVCKLNDAEHDIENTGRKPLDCVDVTTGYTRSGDRITTDGVVVPGGRDKRYVRVYINYNTTGDYLPGDVTPTPKGEETNWQRSRVEEFNKLFKDITTKC